MFYIQYIKTIFIKNNIYVNRKYMFTIFISKYIFLCINCIYLHINLYIFLYKYLYIFVCLYLYLYLYICKFINTNICN